MDDHNNKCQDDRSIFLSGVWFGIFFSFFFLKCIVPCFQYYYYYYYYYYYRSKEKRKEQKSQCKVALQTVSFEQHLPTKKNVNDDDDDDDCNLGVESEKKSLNRRDGSFEVLQGALNLVSQYTCGHGISSSKGHNKKERKVVEFLSPQQILNQFFSSNVKDNETSLFLFNDDDDDDDGRSPPHRIGSKDFVELLRKIQYYSVDTSHNFFFNQLFGAVDPVAMAAEMVALSLNTSVYTFETAPIFTMLERHLVQSFGSFVYNHHRNTEEETDPTTEGLCLPGGSLSNLTALHVARYYALRQHKYQQVSNHNNSNSTRENNTTQLKETNSNYSEDAEEKKNDDQNDDVNNDNRSNIHLEGIIDHHPANGVYQVQNRLVAFISKEAHYSFVKSMNIIGFHKDINLVAIPCLKNGQMDVFQLAKAIQKVTREQNMIPFFVGITAGSTVRGSFDDIPSILQVCRDLQDELKLGHKIWIHVDGAWGGAALFSKHYRALLFQDVEKVDSFTFNPHKLLGAPQQTTIFITKHRNILMDSNATGAKYLFDKRKVGAEYDMGDASYTCGRRTDAIKFWAMWKYYGLNGLEQRVESKIKTLKHLAQIIRNHPSFLLVDEWPFNVNFFYLPRRIRQQLQNTNNNNNNETKTFPLNEKNTKLPDEIYSKLSKVAVQLKTRLHKAGVMLIPYQPLNNLDADCFRIVLAGKKEFTEEDCTRIIDLMQEYGDDL